MKQMLADRPQEETIYYFPVHVMPPRVTPIEVIVLVEAVSRKGGMIELSDLSSYFSRQSLPHFLSILRASQELGLVRREGGRVSITDLGIGFAKVSSSREAIIRSGLTRIEPFKTILELLSKKRSITTLEISEVLIKRRNIILPTSLTSEEFIRGTLFEWGIPSNLLSYDGKSYRLAK